MGTKSKTKKSKKVTLPTGKGTDKYQFGQSKGPITADNDDDDTTKSPGNAGQKAGTSKLSKSKKKVTKK